MITNVAEFKLDSFKFHTIREFFSILTHIFTHLLLSSFSMRRLFESLRENLISKSFRRSSCFAHIEHEGMKASASARFEQTFQSGKCQELLKPRFSMNFNIESSVAAVTVIVNVVVVNMANQYLS